MLNFKKISIVITFGILAHSISAQDIHFSQYNQNPMELNPALAGLNKCDYRVGATARTQWNLVSKSGNTYSTFGVFGDAAVGKVTKFNSFAGIGLSIFSDISGTLSYQMNKASLNAAYHFMLDKRGNASISAGLQFAVNHRGVNLSKATYDSQYDAVNGRVDLSLPSESFMRTNMLYIDAGAGLFYNQFFKEQRHNLYLGIAATHVNQPDISFNNSGLFNMKSPSGAKGERLYLKATIHGGGSINLKEKIWLNPSFMLLFQGPHKEINVGALAKILAGNERTSQTFVYAGAHFRALSADAVILHLRVEHGGLGIGFTYDLNVSKLSTHSSAFGGPELNLVYQGCMNKKAKPFFCPVM